MVIDGDGKAGTDEASASKFKIDFGTSHKLNSQSSNNC